MRKYLAIQVEMFNVPQTFMPFTFNHKKATQALAFFATQSPGNAINKMKALKLVFFADRYHFRRFGRPITGDSYLAMTYGPVPSGTKDLAQLSGFLESSEKQYAAQFLSLIDSNNYRALRPCEDRSLSKSDLDALKWAWDNFGEQDEFALAELTHAYPEWRRYQSKISDIRSRIPMDYLDFLDDSVMPDVNPCFPLTDSRKDAIKTGVEEQAAFEAAW